MRRVGDALPSRGRLVAFDLGRVRVGVSVSDPTQIVASPADTVEVVDLDRGDGMDVEALAARLAGVARTVEAVGVVVGSPLDLDGHEGAAAREARAVADAIRVTSGLPVRLHDERFSTTEAERVLLEGDLSRVDRRRAVDRVAASIILQSVLALQGNQRRHPEAHEDV